MLNPPEPTSKKSCPVARQVEILIVTVAGEFSCKPALIITFAAPSITGLPKPAAVAG